MAGYASRVKADIGRWREAGWIDGRIAETLARDVEARAGEAVSLGSILAILAALLLAAAILVFVASDWDAIPRALRAAGLVALIAALFAAGTALKKRGQAGLGEAAWLAGAAAVGAGILLLKQMYDLAGGEGTFLFVWCAGTAAAAALCRSNPLTVAAAGLAAAWLAVEGTFMQGDDRIAFLYPALALGIWFLSRSTRSVPARSLLLLSVSLYTVLLASRHDALPFGIALAMLAAALFLIAVRRPARSEAWLLLAGHAPAHFLFLALTGLAIVQVDLAGEAGFAISAVAVLATVAAALLFGGRGHRGVRRLAYAAFALEVGVVYVVTVGSLLGTAGFFLVAALLLGIVAVLLIRLERRWTRPERAAQTSPPRPLTLGRESL